MPDEPPWFSTPRHTTSHPLDKLSMSSLKRRFRVSRPRPRPAALKINQKNKYKWATVTLCLTRDARVLKQENALPDDSPLFFTPRHTTSHPLDKLSCERRFSKCHRTPCRTQISRTHATPWVLGHTPPLCAQYYQNKCTGTVNNVMQEGFL